MEDKENIFFQMPVTEVIRKRISIRSYKPEGINEEEKKRINSYISELKGPFDAKVRFKLIDSKLVLESSNIKLGTYGMIRGASSFIASAAEEGEMNLEELGYELEKLILYATSLGLGACWIGGTFKRGEFARAMELRGNELLPIVSPIGYVSEGKNILSSLVRMAAGSKNRKAFEDVFFDGNFDKGLLISEAGIYAEPLEMLRVAPSASNKQPWRIVKDGEKFHFYLCHSRGYSSALGFDMQRIDIGIAMCHFDLTLREMGIGGSFKKCEPSFKENNPNTEYIISWVK